MTKFATSLLTLAMYAAALVMVPMVTPATAATNSSQHTKHKKKIRKSSGLSDSWPAGQARPVAGPSNQAGEVCPGIARSFDCRTWPPPMYDDPDRRVPARR